MGIVKCRVINGLTLNVGYWAQVSGLQCCWNPVILPESVDFPIWRQWCLLLQTSTISLLLIHSVSRHDLASCSLRRWAIRSDRYILQSDGGLVSLCQSICAWSGLLCPRGLAPVRPRPVARALLETLLTLRHEKPWLWSRHLSSSWLLLPLVSQ